MFSYVFFMPKILIIDDKESMRNMLLQAFMSNGYEVFLANSAEKALLLIQGQSFDCCLFDMNMPGKNGLEFLETLGEFRQNAGVLVMISARGENGVEAKAKKLGAERFIKKTEFDPINLVGEINSLLDG